MKIHQIKNSVSTLPGIGPSTAALFANLNIFTAGDLLSFYPKDYEDRTNKIPLSKALNFPKAHTIAKVIGHEWFGYGKMRTLKILIDDGTDSAQLIAFNRPFLEKTFPINSIIAVTGRFDFKYGSLQSTSFEAEKISANGALEDYLNAPVPGSKIVSIYRLTEGLTQKTVQKAILAAIQQYSLGIEDELPQDLITKRNLLHKKDAITLIHNPSTIQDINESRKTLAYEELFHFQMNIAEQAYTHRGTLPNIQVSSNLQLQNEQISNDEFLTQLSPRQKQYFERLPFSLTDDQKSVIFKINRDIDKSYARAKTNLLGECEPTPNFSAPEFSMRALLQGDVGSGKTLVSFFAVLRTCDWGSQAALMAPTEILARQHAENAAKQLEPLNVKVAYLTGNINAKGRLALLEALKKGEIDLVIGTHALFSKSVQYNDLALTIIDEQHRFGVMQRSAIIDKGRNSLEPKTSGTNLLMMSATPIPQTLAQTVFADLDIYTIHTMPQGRKPIQTYLTKEGNEKNAYEAVRKELHNGHQAYFVYPAIGGEEIEQGTFKAAEEMFSFLSKKVYPEFTCALIHGKIDEEEQSRILTEFKEGKIQVLVATTVVEVGVDVPNATCMVIEQADRFGLAALHQLRGRVGRGGEQSYCFLIYSAKITETGIERMKAIRQTTDGFKIAEEDLKLRGPGEITGTLQSGELTFAVADLFRDSALMALARQDAFTNFYAT